MEASNTRAYGAKYRGVLSAAGSTTQWLRTKVVQSWSGQDG